MAKYNVEKPFRYGMGTKKEDWKSIDGQLEKQYVIPIEQQPSIVKELVSTSCYKRLVPLLNLPSLEDSHATSANTVDTITPFTSAENGLATDVDSTVKTLLQSGESRSVITTVQSSAELTDLSYISKRTIIEPLEESGTEPSKEYEALSNFVEVDKKMPQDITKMMKHKAVLRFLALPEGEVATWRTTEAKGVKELSEMTLEQQGDFLINKIATDFCEWMKKLGGDEKSFINEEILKELFEICMDNPASRAICIKTREKRVLYFKLAEFLQVPQKSFHKALSSYLKENAMVEKMPSRLKAFNKSLPKDLQFKTPNNKTSETWLEWNSLSADQLRFGDVFSSIKDLRSTREYCKWLLKHPEHKKPQYFIDQGLFELNLDKKEDEHSQGLFRFTSSSITNPSILSEKD